MDKAVTDEAARLLDVSDVLEFIAGGQKTVATCKAKNGSAVILKVIQLDPAHTDALERARREVDLLGRIEHPNVVRVLSGLVEIGSPASAVAWVEEEIEGQDLRLMLGPGMEWSWADTRAMALDVARGLSALHAQKVVHRDLSPGNVMKRGDGSYVVIDPGFGRHLEESTLTGIYQPGTPGYMTPEHVGARVIYASDVFAVGTLMYQALTGKQPVPFGGVMDSYLIALRDDQVGSVSSERGDLAADQADLVDRCLSRQSGRRYLDARDLAAALEAL